MYILLRTLLALAGIFKQSVITLNNETASLSLLFYQYRIETVLSYLMTTRNWYFLILLLREANVKCVSHHKPKITYIRDVLAQKPNAQLIIS